VPALVAEIRPGCRALAGGRRGGKTALAWLAMREQAKRTGGTILCGKCERPYDGPPPPVGRCVCGSYFFGVRTPEQPALPGLEVR
jgi:hypothetical protein